MSPPFILYRYLAREFVRWFGIIIASLSGIIFIFDLVELLRRTATRNIRLGSVLHMVLLKLPHMVLQLLPFVILLATLIVFWRLMRGRELIMMRMSGLSIWQVLAPITLVVALIKIVELLLINPLSATLYGQFERLESRRIYGKEEKITLTENGLWVRQTDRYGQFMLRAAQVEGQELHTVSIFEFNDRGAFQRRFEAEKAQFQPNSLALENVKIFNVEGHREHYSRYTFVSELSFQQIQEHSAHPSTLSFWKLPEFINFLEKSKLSSHRFRLHLHMMIANVFLAMGMVLLGAGSVFFHLGKSGVFPAFALSIGLGFCVFFISDMARALGLAASIPIFLAAWAPVFIAGLVGVTMVLHSEDV